MRTSSVRADACRLATVHVDRLELVDDSGQCVALARRAAGTDIWIVSHASQSGVERIRGELAARARLAQIAEE